MSLFCFQRTEVRSQEGIMLELEERKRYNSVHTMYVGGTTVWWLAHAMCRYIHVVVHACCTCHKILLP